MLNILCLIHFSRLWYVFTPHNNLEKNFKMAATAVVIDSEQKCIIQILNKKKKTIDNTFSQ